MVDEPGIGEAVGDVAPSGGLGPIGAGRMGLNRLCMDGECDCATEDQVVRGGMLCYLRQLRRALAGWVERFEGAPRCQSGVALTKGTQYDRQELKSTRDCKTAMRDCELLPARANVPPSWGLAQFHHTEDPALSGEYSPGHPRKRGPCKRPKRRASYWRDKH